MALDVSMKSAATAGDTTLSRTDHTLQIYVIHDISFRQIVPDFRHFDPFVEAGAFPWLPLPSLTSVTASSGELQLAIITGRRDEV